MAKLLANRSQESFFQGGVDKEAGLRPEFTDLSSERCDLSRLFCPTQYAKHTRVR